MRTVFVRVTWWEGRTREQKAQVAKAITEAIVKYGQIAGLPTPEYVWIIFEDVKKADWAIGGTLSNSKANK
jgi:4-oxalocrotonate tautomerase